MVNQNQAQLDQNDQNHNIGNFWFGFALGVSLTSAAAFFLGTKKGRKSLKNVLELSEDFEENLLILGSELEEALVEKGGELKEELKELPKVIQKNVAHLEKKHHGLGGLLEKIKTLSPSSQTKKFFAKEGKIINR